MALTCGSWGGAYFIPVPRGLLALVGCRASYGVRDVAGLCGRASRELCVLVCTASGMSPFVCCALYTSMHTPSKRHHVRRVHTRADAIELYTLYHTN